MILLAAISLVVGFVVGVLSGLLGIGGGVFLVPIFKLGYAYGTYDVHGDLAFYHYPYVDFGSNFSYTQQDVHSETRYCSGSWWRMHVADWRLACHAFSRMGHYGRSRAGSRLFGLYDVSQGLGGPEEAEAAPSSRPERGAEKAASENLAIASTVESEGADSEVVPSIGGRQLLIFFFIGMVAGLASGYVGVGGGFIMVPMMISLAHLSMRYTSGTSLVAVMILAVPGVITQAMLGNVDWIAGAAVACGSIPGAMVGAKLVPKVPERTLRFMFSFFLVVAAVLLVVNQLGVWG